jgi:hypothetical protein
MGRGSNPAAATAPTPAPAPAPAQMAAPRQRPAAMPSSVNSAAANNVFKQASGALTDAMGGARATSWAFKASRSARSLVTIRSRSKRSKPLVESKRT